MRGFIGDASVGHKNLWWLAMMRCGSLECSDNFGLLCQVCLDKMKPGAKSWLGRELCGIESLQVKSGDEASLVCVRIVEKQSIRTKLLAEVDIEASLEELFGWIRGRWEAFAAAESSAAYAVATNGPIFQEFARNVKFNFTFLTY